MRSSKSERRRRRVASLIVILLQGSGAAWAQSAEDLRQFRMWAENGTDHFRAGRYDKAVMEFRRALTLVHEPGLTWNIARSYEEIGDVGNAVHYFEEFVARYPDDASADKARQRLADLRLRLPGSLVVQCGDAVAAKVVLDGDRSIKCGRKVSHVEPGRHSLEARAADQAPWRTVVTVAPASHLVVEVDWSAAAPPGADAAVAPSAAASPPEAAAALPAPEAAAAAKSRPSVAPSPGPPSDSLAPTLTLVAAVVLVAGGVAAGAVGVSAQDDYEASKAKSAKGEAVDYRQVEGFEADAQLYPVVANVMLASGALLGALGAYLMWTEGSAAAARPRGVLKAAPGGISGAWTW